MIVTRLPDPPQAEIITLEEVREFCRISADLDAYSNRELIILRDAAIETGEQETGLIWRAAAYEINLAASIPPLWPVQVPIAPALDLKKLVFVDEEGTETEFDSSDYEFQPSDPENRRPWTKISPLKNWPGGTAKLTVTAGWAAGTLPQALRLWALNRVASGNERRGDMQVNVTAAPRKHVDRLLDRYRVYGGFEIG